MVNQILVPSGVLFGLDLEVVESACHDTWVFVTKSLFHLLVHLVNWSDLVKFEKHHDCFFPNHLMLMIQKNTNLLIDCHDHVLIAQF